MPGAGTSEICKFRVRRLRSASMAARTVEISNSCWAMHLEEGQIAVWLSNGVEQSNLLLPETGGWQTYKAVKLTVTLKPGKNRMEIRSQGKSGVNLDYLDLKRLK